MQDFSASVFDNGYFTVTVPMPDYFGDETDVQALRLYFRNLAPRDEEAIITVDSVYLGPKATLPKPLCTVTFVDDNGTVLDEQKVPTGDAVTYKGSTPVKNPDQKYHYTFSGWDKSLSIITADTTVTARYTATAHTFAYTAAEASHTALCACGYSLTSEHSYNGGQCICGATQIIEPMVDMTLKLGHTLNLASDISLSFAIPKSSLAGYDLSTVYLESTMDIYAGNEKTGTAVIRLYPVETGSYYYFTLTGLTALQMNNRISSVLYGTKEGQEYYSPVDNYSIADYAYSRLEHAESSPQLKTLCADLLRYGAYAQIFKQYRTDALVTDSMTQTHKSYLSDMDSVTFANINRVIDDDENYPIRWEGKALNLESKVAVKFIFSLGDYAGSLSDLSLKIRYSDIKGIEKTLTLKNGELYNSKYGFYAFTMDALLAAELRSVISAQIYDGDHAVSPLLEYSAETYGNQKTGALGDLCKALFAYSDSAKAYFLSNLT